MHAHVVVPADASGTKCEMIRSRGAELHRVGADLRDAVDHSRKLADSLGAPYFEYGASEAQLFGAGTIAHELFDKEIDTLFIPLAVGALAGGIARTLARVQPRTRMIGVQARAFNRIAKTLATGSDPGPIVGETFADGLADYRLVDPAFSACRDHLAEVITVDDEEIMEALRLIYREHGSLVEGAGAAAIAGVRRLSARGASMGRVAAIVSGANIDPVLAEGIIGGAPRPSE
jgi:threonine dehydratase